MTLFLITRSDCDIDHTTNDGMVLYAGFSVVRAYNSLEDAKKNLLEAVMEAVETDSTGSPDDWKAKPGMLDDNYKIVQTTDDSNMGGDEAYAAFEIRTIDV